MKDSVLIYFYTQHALQKVVAHFLKIELNWVNHCDPQSLHLQYVSMLWFVLSALKTAPRKEKKQNIPNDSHANHHQASSQLSQRFE